VLGNFKGLGDWDEALVVAALLVVINISVDGRVVADGSTRECSKVRDTWYARAPRELLTCHAFWSGFRAVAQWRSDWEARIPTEAP
jgi:hypothetical protein